MRVLWVDDEIQGFRSHILYLQDRGIEVLTASHPEEALALLREHPVDMVLLDYRMPGLTGEELLDRIREEFPGLKVAFLTMVEDPDVMEYVTRQHIVGYLVKPIRPSQILALLKQALPSEDPHPRRIRTYTDRLAAAPPTPRGWMERAMILARWHQEHPEDDTYALERRSQNAAFAHEVRRNYPQWLQEEDLLWIHRVFARQVVPEIQAGRRVAWLVLDGFRLDQFLDLLTHLEGGYHVDVVPSLSLLPTSTLIARNALFAGLLPIEIHRRFPGALEDNQQEPALLEDHLQRLGLDVAFRYRKWTDPTGFEEVRWSAPLEVVVVSFFDWLSHIWSRHPYFRGLDFQRFVRFLMEETRLKQAIQHALKSGYTVFLSSDHGWVEASQAVVIRAGQDVRGGLRFKWGDSLRVLRGKAIEIRDLEEWGLPRHWGGRLLLAQEDGYFVYETDPSRFRQFYAGWMFHGGVSLQEMVIPVVRIRALEPEKNLA